MGICVDGIKYAGFGGRQGPPGPQGPPGVDGATGPTGPDGNDGFSPTVTVTDITGGHRVTITDADGPQSFDVMDGKDGGVDGVTSFNGRDGAVIPQTGDYTADMVGAWPNTRTPTAADVGAVPAGDVQAVQALTQAEYDAMSTKNAATLYLIKE